ncbi:MAG TPA: radical SAM protein, partial [Anaerolineales bacterium]|nr:radical SAM protein [Anaerolineales bacterium]
IHLPVAPKCNIQCKYCNRRLGCSNECRPGVAMSILSPELALERLVSAKKKVPNITVVGIAGPGDALATPQETFKTFELVRTHFPDSKLCMSTNGLMLPECMEQIKHWGVEFVTVTINAVDPRVGMQIYSWIRLNNRIYRGAEAAEILWDRQKAGLLQLAEANILVKVNAVLIPGINDHHIVEIAQEVHLLGAFILNVIPLIPVDGTEFSSIPAPTLEQRRSIVEPCSRYIKIMHHCNQCRADAVGLLENDLSNVLECRIVC